MRFHLGKIPEDDTFNPEEEGWIRLRDPSASTLIIAAVPLGIAMATATIAVWLTILHASLPGEVGNGFSFTITIPGLLGLIVLLIGFGLLHELLHAAPVLLTGSWNNLVIGFWPRYLSPYFTTIGPSPRNVQMVCGALPFLVLTLLPIFLAVGLSWHSKWLAVLSSLNAAGCGADLIMLIICAWQIPRDAIVRNQGYSTWWKKSLV